ncbi:MAG TPA: haloacid dehalogenase type II [Ktedonobacteraceae bacterium]|nr:haloacid dehalogenase type II [Ktedonobacteraceae bacterium]
MSRICVCDVNETLLDLSALDPLFQRIFGEAALRQVWFRQMLQSAFVSTILDSYRDFGTIAAAALTMVAAHQDIALSAEDQQAILGAMRHLPPHPEVRESLERLRHAGRRIVALTNSTLQTARMQLTHAGLAPFFEQVFSCDTVARLKPAPEVYRMVATSLGVEMDQLRLIAAHSWDVAGAMHAGCAAAFVARPGMVLDPLFTPPDIIGADLREVVASILAHDER